MTREWEDRKMGVQGKQFSVFSTSSLFFRRIAVSKILKWLGIALAGLAGLLIVAAALVFFLSESRINKTYVISVNTVPVGADAETLARGEHLAITRGCTDCHGANLAGGAFIDDPAIGRISASNLTSGRGGVGNLYRDEDWVRAIRHGVGPDGKPLLFMPAQEFYYLSDEDLGALIAYMRTIPPVDNVPPEDAVRPLGRILFLAGKFPLIPAEMIDHDAPRPEAPEPGVTVAYGQYLAVGCAGCHGQDFTGGPIPGMPPGTPPAADLTPSGHVADWSEAEFIAAMRTGVSPDGHEISPVMPLEAVGAMTDDELKAIWLFLQSLPLGA